MQVKAVLNTEQPGTAMPLQGYEKIKVPFWSIVRYFALNVQPKIQMLNGVLASK